MAPIRRVPAAPADRATRRRTARTGVLAGVLAILAVGASPMVSAMGDALGDEPAGVVAATDAQRVSGRDGDGTVTVADASPAAPAVVAEAEPSPSDPDAAEPSEDAASAPDEDPDGAAGDQRSVWDRLADCESGDRDEHGSPRPGSARWDYGIDFAHAGYEQFEGGLNFAPGTWDAYRDPGMPDHAGRAPRASQIRVAERVLEAQGWQAWPVCSRLLGLR